MNPYADQNFLGFFEVLFRRLCGEISGALFFDELQLLVLSGIAISCVCVGTFLIVRQMTMLANALSHTILLGIVSCVLLMPTEGLISVPLLMITSLITGLVTTFLTQGLQRWTRLQEDASIGLIFSLLFALGLFLVSVYMRNLHVGTELIMGNADALIPADLTLTGVTLLINLALFALFFRGYQLTAFDPLMAKALGFSPALFTYLLMTQASLTTMSAFRCIGVFMVLALLVVPPLIIRLFIHRLVPLLIASACLSVVVVILGVALSRHLLTTLQVGLSTGGIIVTLLFLIFLLAALCKVTSFGKPAHEKEGMR